MTVFTSFWAVTRIVDTQRLETSLQDAVVNSSSREVVRHVRHGKVSVGRSEFEVEKRTMHGEVLTLKGICELSYFGIGVCDAALYLPETADNKEVLMGKVSKELQIKYHHYIPASQFQYQTKSLIEKNGYFQQEPAVERLTARFVKLYTDVNANDKFTLSFASSTGKTTLFHNDRLLGSIEDKGISFSTALFSVWFGEYPFLEYMKASLLSPVPSALLGF